MPKKNEAFPKKIYLKPSLAERLKQLLAVPLTVAVAPFGYGKTTAVKKHCCPCLWICSGTIARLRLKRCFGAASSARCRRPVSIPRP